MSGTLAVVTVYRGHPCTSAGFACPGRSRALGRLSVAAPVA